MALLGQYHVFESNTPSIRRKVILTNTVVINHVSIRREWKPAASVTLRWPSPTLNLNLHHGKARQINSILTPQDTERERKPDTCHVFGQAFAMSKMVSDAQLFDIIEETRRTWSWFGKGRSWTFQKAFTHPRFDQEQLLLQKIDKARLSVSFTCWCCSTLCKNQVLLSAFSPLSVAELLPLCEWETSCFFECMRTPPSIRKLEKFGVDWAKSVMFEGKTGLRGHDPRGCTLQKRVIKPVRKVTVGSCSCMWLDLNSDQVCSLQSQDMLHKLKNYFNLASSCCKSSSLVNIILNSPVL